MDGILGLFILAAFLSVGVFFGYLWGQDVGWVQGFNYAQSCYRENQPPKRPFQVASHKPMQRHSTGIMEVR